MRVLITGGNGFLGAWIVKRLRARGIDVRVFDVVENRTLVDAIAGDAGAAVEWRVGDIVNGLDVRRAAEGCEGIINLAGILTPACKADPVRGSLINYIGTLNAFEAARAHGIKRFVYTSSAGVFGSPTSSDPWPITHYGTAKLACEGSARAYWDDLKLASIGMRPFIVYGPGRLTGMSAGTSLACRAAARGENYVIPFSGQAGFVFVDDVAAAYEHALAREPDGAHVFNICGVSSTNEKVIEIIRRSYPKAELRVEGPDIGLRPDIDDDALFAAMPGLKRTSLEDGIEQTLAYYRRQGQR